MWRKRTKIIMWYHPPRNALNSHLDAFIINKLLNTLEDNWLPMFHLQNLFCFSVLVFNFCFVFCFALQSGKKVTSDPSPFVRFTVGHKSFESKVRPRSDPQRLYVIYQQSERSFRLRKSFGDFVHARYSLLFSVWCIRWQQIWLDLTVLFLFFPLTLSDHI